jgi:hypothetical protein
MRTRKPRRLTYANAMSTLAVFLALGGGAVWAAGKLGRNEVTARNLAPKSVGGSELKPDAAKGADIKEASLAEVPRAAAASNSDLLNGLPASSLIRTAGTSTADAPDADGTATATTIQVPASGYLTIFGTADFVYGSSGSDQVECRLAVDGAAIAASVRVTNVSGAANVDSDCATNVTRSIAPGSHEIALDIDQLDNTSVAAAGVSVIYSPFGATGG